jgi:hypothetical protein
MIGVPCIRLRIAFHVEPGKRPAFIPSRLLMRETAPDRTTFDAGSVCGLS